MSTPDDIFKAKLKGIDFKINDIARDVDFLASDMETIEEIEDFRKEICNRFVQILIGKTFNFSWE